MEYNYIEEGNYVRCYDTETQYFAKILQIEKERKPWVEIETIPNRIKKSVSEADIGYITTKVEHLIRLGFKCKTIDFVDFYERGTVIITAIRITKEKYIFSSGLRLVENFNPWTEIEKYLINDRIDNESFDKDFYEVNELNRLLKLLHEREMAVQSIDDILGF